MTTYLKVLDADNQSCHGGNMDWTPYLPTTDGPGKPLPVIDRPELCESGYHWTTEPGLMQRWARSDMRVYVAEPSPDVTTPDMSDKSVSSGGRLLGEYELPQWWRGAMAFLHDIPATPWMQPGGKPLPDWQVYRTRGAARDAARGAAWDAAWDAARDAAWDVAWNAAWDAARDAAWSAAWGAARNAAWDAARDAARDAAWSATAVRDTTQDAALYTVVVHICDGLALDQTYIDHAVKRWQVWQKGYGLVADVDGVFYVYEAVA